MGSVMNLNQDILLGFKTSSDLRSMSMMNTNSISKEQFQSLGKKLVKLKPISLKTDRKGIIRTGQRNQNPREEIITILVNQAPDVHALEVEEDDLETTKAVQETIEDVLETSEIIVIEL